jgi:D-alanyl-D-alanine-carboxypeptidase/D-alanyl-D-alanine-endopeptidase
MHKEALAIVLTGALMTSANAVAATDFPADTASYIQRTIDNGTYVGVIVGLIDGKDTVIKGFGVASKETNKAPDEDTVFEIGSITKTFTATLLAEEALKGG